MNINQLEDLARQALKGENIASKSSKLLREGKISRREHRSLRCLSLQITSNVLAASGGVGTLAFDSIDRAWL
jgi:hypothetical protein